MPHVLLPAPSRASHVACCCLLSVLSVFVERRIVFIDAKHVDATSCVGRWLNRNAIVHWSSMIKLLILSQSALVIGVCIQWGLSLFNTNTKCIYVYDLRRTFSTYFLLFRYNSNFSRNLPRINCKLGSNKLINKLINQLVNRLRNRRRIPPQNRQKLAQKQVQNRPRIQPQKQVQGQEETHPCKTSRKHYWRLPPFALNL